MAVLLRAVPVPELTGTFQPWRLLTGLLVHGGFWHVGLNMLAVWMIGRSLEPLLGHARFLALYLISGLGGSVAVALLSFGTPVVGASGAVFGLLGALLVIGRHIGANITGILIILGINLVIGFIPGMGVSWQAHVGGLVVGALIGLIYARTRVAAAAGAADRAARRPRRRRCSRCCWCRSRSTPETRLVDGYRHGRSYPQIHPHMGMNHTGVIPAIASAWSSGSR